MGDRNDVSKCSNPGDKVASLRDVGSQEHSTFGTLGCDLWVSAVVGMNAKHRDGCEGGGWAGGGLWGERSNLVLDVKVKIEARDDLVGKSREIEERPCVLSYLRSSCKWSDEATFMES